MNHSVMNEIFVYTLCYVQIEKVMEDRARSVDLLKSKYYDLLYCFHITRKKYRKGKIPPSVATTSSSGYKGICIVKPQYELLGTTRECSQ